MYLKSGTGVATKTGANGRVFIFEVEGLRQGENTDKLNFPIRRSGVVYITVPYERMNQEMRRIARLGGKLSIFAPQVNLKLQPPKLPSMDSRVNHLKKKASP